MSVNRSRKLYKRRNNRRKMNTKRKVRKITKRKVRKNTKRKVRKNTKRKVIKNTNRKNIRKSSKNKIRHKRGGSTTGIPLPVLSSEPGEPPLPVLTDIMIRSIVEITEPDGIITKNAKISSTLVDLNSKHIVEPAGITIVFVNGKGEEELVLLKVCKHGESHVEKELTVGKEIGDIKGLIKPITLGYLGLVEAGHSDEKLPAMIDRPDWSDTITWIEEPTRYYVMYKYIDGYTLLDFYEQILEKNYDNSTLYINRIISVIISEILIALRNIHERGWVHNDLSLENIMITDYNCIDKIAQGDDTEKPTITIIDLDACEKCAHSNECMESLQPGGIVPKKRKDALEQKESFNGRLSDICSVGIAINYIFEKLLEDFPYETYSVNDEVVQLLMDEKNYRGVEDAITLTHTYITNYNLFKPVPQTKSVAQTEIEALEAEVRDAYRKYKQASKSNARKLKSVYEDAYQRLNQAVAKKEAEEEEEREDDDI